MKRFLVLLYLLISTVNLKSQNFKVLFIGNSYTAVNNLPLTVSNIATSLGDTLTYDSNTPGGYTFNLHSSNVTTLSKINAQAWDFVVLQEQSQLPSFDPTQVDVDVYPYARKLDSLILANDSCTETFFYMTWGRQNGDLSNCAAYPPVCTYNGMQQRLRDSYMEMSVNNHGSVSPVGVAWKNIRDNYPGINLYQADESHPSVHGTYLAACVFYSSLFHKSTVGSSFISAGISAADAIAIQTIASSTVLDSMMLWQGNGDVPIANFNYTSVGSTIQFINTSSNSLNYSWNFGDGNIATTTAPQNTYLVDGQYLVTLTASSNCLSYTFTDTLFINSTDVSNDEKNSSFDFSPNPVQGDFYISFAGKSYSNINLLIYNSLGQVVSNKNYKDVIMIHESIGELNAGLYTLILYSENNQIGTKKMIVGN